MRPLLLLTLVLALPAADREFTPAMAAKLGFIDVSRPPYAVVGDGTTDCTETLQRAISECATPHGGIVYLPAGTYVVSRPLVWRNAAGEWRCWVGLQGQSRAQTIVRLRDRAAGFTDPAQPAAVLVAAAGWLGKDGDGGGRNDAYHNDVRDLTIDLGSGNPGAVGIDWMATNQGVIDSTTVRAAPGSGAIGIAMHRAWPGPALIRNCVIEGCAVGFSLRHANQGMTVEGLTLRHQREVGIACDLNGLAVRRLASDNLVPAVRLTSSFAREWGRFPALVLIDADLRGGGADQAAIDNQAGYVLARDVVTSGYRVAMRRLGSDVPGTTLTEYTSDAPVGGFPASAPATLRLPVAECPDLLDGDPGRWASVTDFGAVSDDGQDDTAAIQRALDSGAAVVCFPGGVWHLSDTLHLRGALRALYAGNAIFLPAEGHRFGDRAQPRAVLRIEGGSGDLAIERFEARFAQAAGSICVEHASPRRVILRNCQPGGGFAPYRSTPGCGDLHLEDVATHTHNQASWLFLHPQRIWARQFNSELRQTNVVNRGATLWILGYKSEDGQTNIETSDGGTTELLGGCIYPASVTPQPDTAAFIVRDARVSLSWFFCGQPGGPYPVWVRETAGGVARDLVTRDLPEGRDRAVPLYRSTVR